MTIVVNHKELSRLMFVIRSRSVRAAAPGISITLFQVLPLTGVTADNRGGRDARNVGSRLAQAFEELGDVPRDRAGAAGRSRSPRARAGDRSPG